MAYDETLARRIREVLRDRCDVVERKMFGGLAFLYGGRMCYGIVGNDLMVRIADDEFDAVMRTPRVRPMDFTGRPLKGFVYVSPQAFRTPRALRGWLARGERFVQQTPARPAKSQAGKRRGIRSRSR